MATVADPEQETRWLSELSAGLREHVQPPDRWTARIESFGDEEGDSPPWRAVVVRFRRTVDGRLLQWQQVLAMDLIEYSVMGRRDLARYLAEKWQHEAAAATERGES